MAPRTIAHGLLALALAVIPRVARADEADDPAAWLGGLYDRLAADVKAGRPVVVQAHVALCDNGQVRCGGRGRGDGDDLAQNLYWATSGGVVGWFHRRGSGWREVHREADPRAGVLELRVFHREVPPEGALRARGLRRPFPAYVVAYAWRGARSTEAFAAFAADLLGDRPREIDLPDGTRLRAGGEAHAVAYVGHNRLMDLSPAEQRAVLDQRRAPEPRAKGMIAVACWTVAYLLGLAGPARPPLLLTADLLFAGAHSFEGTAFALLRGAALPELREAAVLSYAGGEAKEPRRVRSVFTNPADPRWPKFLARFSED